MAKHIWSYLFNTFEKNTRNSNIKMLSLATDTLSKLKAQSSIAVVPTILSSYEPVYEAYKSICAQYDAVAGTRQGQTLQLDLLLKKKLLVELRKWEAAVRSVYVEDSAQEKAIFPNKRDPFINGTYEERILSVSVLAKSLLEDGNFTTLASQVENFYNLLLNTRDQQQQLEGNLGMLSNAREQQRKLMAVELYAALALLMYHFKNTPEQVAAFFDLSLLRQKYKKNKV